MAASGGHWKGTLFTPAGGTHVDTVRKLTTEYKRLGAEMFVEMGRRAPARNMFSAMPTTKRYDELSAQQQKIAEKLAKAGYRGIVR